MIFIKGIASLGAAALIGLSAAAAQAGYVVDLTQEGGNVVATGSGAIDLTGLSFVFTREVSAFIDPFGGGILTGPTIPDFQAADIYSGITGPASFGGGASPAPSSGSGDIVGVGGGLLVPTGYVSGHPLSDTSTYDGETFATIGVTPGKFEWTWGTGPNQNFTLVVGTAAVPEPSTWAMMLLGFAGVGFVGYQSAGRRRTAGNA
jgi:hypothetical protein